MWRNPSLEEILFFIFSEKILMENFVFPLLIFFYYGLEILNQCGKRVETKSENVFGANFYICRSYRGKTGRGGAFFAPHFE